uniref:Bifunctional inhibitor/plant lipid transfer protein/seed storage helical domain-containing protein n=1 Tax=Lactuca sativa TaxID=4236 RepID=A0A9R1UXJ1_LACSA|nr:hypothetical protein LSAT_V11C700343000 [Lactuca sativa]
MKVAAVRIAWTLVIILVFGVGGPNTQVEGQLTLPCMRINLRMITCYLHVITCHPNCRKAPCNDQCTPPPISCCIQLVRIGKGIQTDADAKNLCDCIQETVVDRQGTPFTGIGLSVLPKECMLSMKLPPVKADTNCKKWKKKMIVRV